MTNAHHHNFSVNIRNDKSRSLNELIKDLPINFSSRIKKSFQLLKVNTQ